MTEEIPKKTLTIKRKRLSVTTAPEGEESSTPAPIRRSRKRVLTFDKPKKKQPAPPPKPKKPKKPPSTIRARDLDQAIGTHSKIWRSHAPLALGIEKQLFRLIATHHLSASKRVVKSLLVKHCNNPNYLRDIQDGATRYNLDGTSAGTCHITDEENARKRLKQLEIQKLTEQTLKKNKRRIKR